MSNLEHYIDEPKLFNDVQKLIEETQQRVLHQISHAGVMLYWHIGSRINNDILEDDRAKYGREIIKNLAAKLQIKYGKGYSIPVIYKCVQFSKLFNNSEVVFALSSHLKWTHFVNLLNIEDKLKREFYAEMCRIERWSTRKLNDKISSMLYERTAIAKKPGHVIESEINKMRESDIVEPDFIIQDPYIFEYLGKGALQTEKGFEQAIIDDIENSLLNMGSGFTFQERQKVIEVDGTFYKIDLLMYNRRLNRLVAIQLKKGRFKAEHKGQIELYLRWLEKYEKQPNEKSPLGIVLCTEKSDAHVELLQLENSGIRISQVITDLPSKEIFEERLNKAIQRARETYVDEKFLEENSED